MGRGDVYAPVSVVEGGGQSEACEAVRAARVGQLGRDLGSGRPSVMRRA